MRIPIFDELIIIIYFFASIAIIYLPISRTSIGECSARAISIFVKVARSFRRPSSMIVCFFAPPIYCYRTFLVAYVYQYHEDILRSRRRNPDRVLHSRAIRTFRGCGLSRYFISKLIGRRNANIPEGCH